MSDTENTNATPKEKKPTLSATYVKLLSSLLYALKGLDPVVINDIMTKMAAFAPVEEQILFYENLCSNENWKVLIKDYKAYVKENEKATKAEAKKAAKKKSSKDKVIIEENNVISNDNTEVIIEENVISNDDDVKESSKPKASKKKASTKKEEIINNEEVVTETNVEESSTKPKKSKKKNSENQAI